MGLIPDNRDPLFSQVISFFSRKIRNFLGRFIPAPLDDIPAEKIFVCGNAFMSRDVEKNPGKTHQTDKAG